MFEALSQHSQGKGLQTGNGFITDAAIRDLTP
jgi:hypothetical protein